MYHCHIQVYFIGAERDLFEIIKEMPPLERFTHSFVESDQMDPALMAQSDVILACVQEMGPRKMLDLLKCPRKPGAELIILLDSSELAQVLMDTPADIEDIWLLPMSASEIHFRFLKWQKAFKRSKDYWETDNFLETCINGTPNLIWFKTKDGVHEKVNDSFCKTVKRTKEQVVGQHHCEIWGVAREDPSCILSDQEVIDRGRTCMANEVVHTAGEDTLLTTYKSPLFDLDGSIMGTVGVGIDVTRERAYEREITDKNRTLEMLISSMDCGVMCHSVDGARVVSINEAALKLLGYESREELLRDGFDLVAQSVLDEDKPRLRQSITGLKQVGDSVSAEYRVRHKDGKILHIMGNVKLVEQDGELLYQRFLLDYTAQKHQEEARWAEKDRETRHQENLFKLFSTFLSDNVDDIYIMIDGEEKQVEFVTPNIERVLGVPAEDVVHDIIWLSRAEYLTKDEVDWKKELADLTPGEALEPVETVRIHQKTGEKKWFRESVHCVSVDGTKKIIVYISDRTRERTTQNALSEALEMAKVANEAKSTFLSNVSHDIRTPMNAIMGFLTLLKEEAEDPERVREYTQKISAASQHLLGLINDVLDMTKIESGNAVLNLSEMNMAEVIDEINTMIRPQTKAKNQSFEIFAESLKYEHLLGDKLRINQILINILSNAVKYTPEGGRISMQVRELPQVDPNYSLVQFTISDNGQGMSEDFLQTIFDPFTREHTAWNKIQGTGLGMAITKRLVDLMNGTIRVDSELGEGSTFTVELELRIQEGQKVDPEFWKRCGLRRMLVADDDEDICLDIRKKMAGTGVEIHYATDGAQAIEMIRGARVAGAPYDLILLDWNMPDLDGLATARLVRRNYSDKTPILLFTAYDWGDIEEEATEVGIKHFLPKPFFMSNFKDAIERMMEKERKSMPVEKKESIMKGKNILVVDDIDVNRMILVKILSTLGATCDTAVDGQKAVEKFESSQPGQYDIIFMDIQMPNMNGYEATQAIRASSHPSAQTIAIIAMTANAFVDDIRASLKSGMDAHVAKPVVLDILEKTVREVLESKAQQKN